MFEIGARVRDEHIVAHPERFAHGKLRIGRRSLAPLGACIVMLFSGRDGMHVSPDLSQLGFTDLPAVEQSLARSLPKNYPPRIVTTPTPLSRSVTLSRSVSHASCRASPLRKAWREAQSSRPRSAEEIEVLAQLGDAIKRLRSRDSEGLANTLPLGSTRRPTT